MEGNHKFLDDYQVGEDEERVFKLKPSSAKQYTIFLSLLGLILISFILFVIFAGMNIWMLIYAVVMSIIVIFLTPVLWQERVKRFMKYELVPAMERYKEIAHPAGFMTFVKENVGKILGYRFNPNHTYYLEAAPHDVDLTNNSALLKHHAFDVTTTALGFSFILTMIFSWFLSDISESNWFILLYVAVGLAFASPIIVSLLVPIMWTLEDTAVKAIDENHVIKRFGYKMRQGVFDRMIGKGGIILGFSQIYKYVIEFELNLEFIELSSIGQILWAAVIFLSAILLMGIPCILSTMRYLRLYHQDNVNLTRNILKTVLPIGYTVVKAETKY